MKKCTHLFFLLCFVLVLYGDRTTQASSSETSYHTASLQSIGCKIFFDDNQDNQREDSDPDWSQFVELRFPLLSGALLTTGNALSRTTIFRYGYQAVYLLLRNIRI